MSCVDLLYTEETRIDFVFLNLYLSENSLLHNVKLTL